MVDDVNERERFTLKEQRPPLCKISNKFHRDGQASFKHCLRGLDRAIESTTHTP